MANEKSIEQSFVRWCDRNGYMCLKLLLHSQRGWPDRCVPLPGNRVVWIEFKTEDGETSPQQDFWRGRLNKHGHYVHVCRSLEEAIKAVEKCN